ncbi:MAG: LLM class flavin-dependent oxidoreductase [Betaproteobacteria bacterium]|nr:LLM class flavin-dependent oxidoreductase [Betaproteobacteria bacterium]
MLVEESAMATATITFGCSLNQAEPHHVAEFAQRAEAFGYDRLVAGEHVQDGNPPIPRILSLPVLAAAAAATRQVRVMSGIVIAPLYHPVMLAKLVATVDRIANGRLDFGIGISGQRSTRIEYDILNVPVETRGRRTNEMLPLLRRLWTEQHVTHKGEFYQFEDATLLPQPVQKPCPPIWIAGRSDAAMKRAATLGDGWYPYLFTVRRLKESNETIRTEAQAAGRDLANFRFGVAQPTSISEDRREALAVAVKNLGKYATAQRSAEDVAKGLCLTGTVQDCIKGIQDRIDAGVRHINLAFLAKDEQDAYRQMELVATQVIPSFR